MFSLTRISREKHGYLIKGRRIRSSVRSSDEAPTPQGNRAVQTEARIKPAPAEPPPAEPSPPDRGHWGGPQHHGGTGTSHGAWRGPEPGWEQPLARDPPGLGDPSPRPAALCLLAAARALALSSPPQFLSPSAYLCGKCGFRVSHRSTKSPYDNAFAAHYTRARVSLSPPKRRQQRERAPSTRGSIPSRGGSRRSKPRCNRA